MPKIVNPLCELKAINPEFWPEKVLHQLLGPGGKILQNAGFPSTPAVELSSKAATRNGKCMIQNLTDFLEARRKEEWESAAQALDLLLMFLGRLLSQFISPELEFDQLNSTLLRVCEDIWKSNTRTTNFINNVSIFQFTTPTWRFLFQNDNQYKIDPKDWSQENDGIDITDVAHLLGAAQVMDASDFPPDENGCYTLHLLYPDYTLTDMIAYTVVIPRLTARGIASGASEIESIQITSHRVAIGIDITDTATYLQQSHLVQFLTDMYRSGVVTVSVRKTAKTGPYDYCWYDSED